MLLLALSAARVAGICQEGKEIAMYVTIL